MDIPSRNEHPVVVKWLLVAGLALVTNLFVLQIERVVFHEPQFERYCEPKQVQKALETEGACVGVGGQWTENVPSMNPKEPLPLGYCNENFTCQNEYDRALEIFQRNSFVVSVLMGVVILALATFLSSLAGVVGNGLSFGSILLLVVSSMEYWSYMEEWLRLIVLAVAFVALIVIAVKKFGKQE